MELQALYYVIALVMVVVGVAGVILPVLPGLPLVFFGMLLAAWADGFDRIGALTLVVLGLLTALSLVVDFLASAMGAKRAGASRLAVIGALAGSVVGIFFGLPGLLAGPFIGALAGELIHARRLAQATRVGVATWIGLLLGTALKVGLAFAMLGLFAFAWFF